MDDAEGIVAVIVAIIILLIVILVLFFFLKRSLKKLKFAYFTKKMKTTSIVDIRPGIVEIKGKAIPIHDTLVTSAILERNVIFYDTKVEKFYPSGETGSYGMIWSRKTGSYFLVDDGTARIKIDPVKAEYLFNSTVKEATYGKKNVSPQFIAFLQRKGLLRLDTNGFLMDDFRYTEKYLDPYQEVHIIGKAVDEGLGVELDRDTTVMPYTITKDDKTDIFFISDQQEKYLLHEAFAVHSLIVSACMIGILFLLSMIGAALYVLIFIP